MDLRQLFACMASCIIVCFTLLSKNALASLAGCEDQFVNNDLANAPTLFNSPPNQPFASNFHLCYQVDNTSFFAIEYWPERFSPRWAAYKLSGDDFGVNGCSTYTRAMGNCYINETRWEAPFSCNRKSDPFHEDYLLDSNSLHPNAFSNTGHDRGHIAPRQSFSWHVCGTYQTFTMANMSPQTASLNQGIWADLENQVLTWAIDHGPLYVVSGTTYRRFPHRAFSVYGDGTLDPNEIYTPGLTLEMAAIRLRDNADNMPSGHILQPRRAASPNRMNDDIRSLTLPTGYFQVVYRPASENEPARAIGFLLPHSFERLRMLADNYDGFEREQAYWAFSSRIDVIEQVAGIRFPAIPDNLKMTWRDPWFYERRGGRDVRDRDCGVGTPAGVTEGTPREERLLACKPLKVDHE